MTSKGSLAKKNKFKPLLHEILWTARRYWWLTLLGIAAFSFVFFVVENNDPRIFALSTHDSSTLLRVGAVLFGGFTAYVLFAFLWRKRESNLYMTIGISRRKLFAVRYLFGVVTILLSLLLPILLKYASEMRLLAPFTADPHGIGTAETLRYSLCLMTLSLLGFTVATLISVLCGSFMGAVLCGGGVLAAPYCVLYCVQRLIFTFLHGSPLGASSDASYAVELPNLFTQGRKFALLTLLEEETAYHPLHVDTDIFTVFTSRDVLEQIPFTELLILWILTVALALLAGYAFCRRPAEVSGKWTVHPVLSHVVAISVATMAACVWLLSIPTVAGVFLFFLIMAGAMYLLQALLSGRWKASLPSLSVMGGTVAVTLAVIICLATGWFGYSTYLPEAEDIASVTVSYNQNIRLMENRNVSYWYSGQGGTTTSEQMGDNTCSLYSSGFVVLYTDLPALTSEADIDTVLTVHKAILDGGKPDFTKKPAEVQGDTVVPAEFYIIYTLKNGDTVTRYYPYLTLDTLETTLACEDTEAFKSSAPENEVAISDDRSYEFGNTLFGCFEAPTLTSRQRADLIQALLTDEAALTVEDRYGFSDTPAEFVGVIRASGIAGLQNAYHTDNPHPATKTNSTHYVTTAYKNTLAFMEENGLSYLFGTEDTCRITGVRTQRYVPRIPLVPLRTFAYVFFSCEDTLQFDANYDIVTLGEELWADYVENSVPMAFLSRPGTLVEITYETSNGETRTVTRYRYDK